MSSVPGKRSGGWFVSAIVSPSANDGKDGSTGAFQSSPIDKRWECGQPSTIRPTKGIDSTRSTPTFAVVRSSHHIMRERRLTAIVQTMCVVGAVSGVSGFTQSNTLGRVNAVREYVAENAIPNGPVDVPGNVVAPSYRPLIRLMLERSATFRRQCLRIGNTPDLLITLHRSDAASPWTRARARIARAANGTLLAAIEVVGREDLVELIAHEFEHVIEQLDGVDLPARARLASTGVSRGSGEANAFETVRARRVGLIVSAEVRNSGN